jgi:polysaccharide export outer membrane protein
MYRWKVFVFAMIACASFGALHAQKPPALVTRNAPPVEYKLRVGDVIQLDFRLSPELNQIATVDPDGTVSLLVVGRIPLEGLTLPQARQLVLSKESKHLVNPEINLQITNFQRDFVVVAGEVFLPQKIEMRSDMTALQAIMQAGGIKISGRETQVLLYRRMNSEFAEVHKLNLRIKETAQLDHDMKLQSGDLILVPRNKVESVSRYVRIAGLSYNFTPQAY